MTDETYYDDKTLEKVKKVLEKYLDCGTQVIDVVTDLQNEGILFRERINPNTRSKNGENTVRN